MLKKHKSKKTFVILLVFGIFNSVLLYAQYQRLKPEWYFGALGAVNFNYFSSNIKNLNSTIEAPSEFKKGSGINFYFAPLLEYHPHPVWSGMLQLGFDGRGGSFDDIDSSGTKFSLSSSMNYISLEPSLRISPFAFDLYFYTGPRLGFNVAKTFTYKRENSVEQKANWDAIRSVVVTGQVGIGYDFTLSGSEAKWQTIISPFLSFHFGQGPRSNKDWGLTSLRLGAAVKFGSTTEIVKKLEREIQFSVQAPKLIPSERKVNETFPIRNYIFFDEGSNQIPARYVKLTKEEAKNFRESHLLQPQPKDLAGRSRRQMTVYHNILNILGDRLRQYPQTTLTLIGSSLQGASNGKLLAEAVKSYLVDIFEIDDFRIKTEGREKPLIPSMLPGATRELDLVAPEDRRVEIVTNNIELLQPVQIISIQTDPLDCDVIFNVSGAEELLASWAIETKDEEGNIQRFGPFTSAQERISGKKILGNKTRGNYQFVMIGESKGGQAVRKEQSIRLARAEQPEEELGLRFSILFEFDQSKTVATYERFLVNTISPLIPEGGSVIIHGHTDIIGEERHNLKLSRDRANEAMNIIERELRKAGKRYVKFDTYGFGEDTRRAPFENDLPEERFYNRTVIIDIIPE